MLTLQQMISLDRTLRIDWDAVLDPNSLPSLADFTVTSSVTGALGVISVVLVGKSAYVGVSANQQGLISVNYSGTAIKNLAGDAAPAIINQLTVNNSGVSDVTPPYPIGATLSGIAALFYFSEILDPAHVPDPSSIAIMFGSIPLSPIGLTIYGNLLSGTLAVSTTGGIPSSWTYAPPVLDPLQDYAGLKVAPITAASVIENINTAVVGYYADRSDVEDQYGIENVQKWSQLDATKADTADTSRIRKSLVYQDNWLNRELRLNNYNWPLSTASEDFDELSDLASMGAGIWLYRSRGKADAGKEMEGKLSEAAKYIRNEIRNIMMRGIDQPQRNESPPIQVVCADDPVYIAPIWSYPWYR